MTNYFPSTANLSNGRGNMAIQLLEIEFFDQSLYEYLIEFLLVFISPKGDDKNGCHGISF